jgi:hypothetical protein
MAATVAQTIWLRTCVAPLAPHHALVSATAATMYAAATVRVW